MKSTFLLLILFFCSQQLSGEESAQFPGLHTVERIGSEIQKEQEIYYTKGGLSCTGRKAVYTFEFVTFCNLNRDEMRAVTLLLLDSVLIKLAKEPVIADYFKGNKNYEEQLRCSIKVMLTSKLEKTATNLEKPLCQACHFCDDTFEFITIDPRYNNRFRLTHKESYKQAKELYDRNPVKPRLTLSQHPLVAT